MVIYNELKMIRVHFYASLKDVAGQSFIEVPLSAETTVEGVWDSLLARYPDLDRYRSIILIAVNEHYADWNTPVRPDDDLALFPPVSGGAL